MVNSIYPNNLPLRLLTMIIIRYTISKCMVNSICPNNLPLRLITMHLQLSQAFFYMTIKSLHQIRFC